MMVRVLVFGAHPDDCDFTAGGTCARYSRAGHAVTMVSLTDGAAGHHQMCGPPLAQRRRFEAAAAARVLGVEHDGLAEPVVPVLTRCRVQ